MSRLLQKKTMTKSLIGFDLDHLQPILGIDEVGLGCVAGPIVAAGVVLPEDLTLKKLLVDSGVKDSKRLTPARRKIALEAIESSGAHIFIASATAQQIDEIGLPACLDRAYRSIISECLQNHRIRTILLDGSRNPRIQYSLKTVVKGDSKSLSIAAASIVAKEHREQMMHSLSDSEEFAKYGWDKNSGYPTKDHLQAIKSHGPSSKHRMSTRPLAAYRSSSTTPGGKGFLNGG